MSRVFIGYLWEKLLWFIILLASFVFVLYATYGFLQEYWSFKINTDIQVKSATDITFPALTICNTNVFLDIWAGGMACYGTLNVRRYNQINNYTLPCRSESNIMLQQILKKFKDTVLHPTFPDSCIILNPYGNLTKKNLVRPLYNVYTLKSGPPLNAYVHDHNDIGFSLNDRAQFLIPLKMDVTIYFRNKQIINRLPAPYTSLCENKLEKTIFPGPYSVSKCKNTCIFKMMLSKCGDVIDQWQIFLTKRKPINKTDDEVRVCLKDILITEFRGLVCDCPVRCKEMFIEATIGSVEKSFIVSKLRLKYLSSTYTEITEVPAYPASKFITDIGGWLSLFTGMSFLSVLEIVLFILLIISALCRRLNHIYKKDK